MARGGAAGKGKRVGNYFLFITVEITLGYKKKKNSAPRREKKYLKEQY